MYHRFGHVELAVRTIGKRPHYDLATMRLIAAITHQCECPLLVSVLKVPEGLHQRRWRAGKRCRIRQTPKTAAYRRAYPRTGPSEIGPCPVLPRISFGSASLPAEYDRQIVRRHLMDFRLPEAVKPSAAGDILDIAQTPFRIARPQLAVERHVAR